MSLLDNLIEFSNAKLGGERASSLSLRTRFTDDDAQEVEHSRTASKSLSKPFKAQSKDLLSASNMTNTGKALYKLTYILNKKLRAIRYCFFVKLETLKKLGLRIQKEEPEETSEVETSPKKCDQQQTASQIPELPQEKVARRPQRPLNVLMGANFKQHLTRLRQTFDMLYLKHFTSKTQDLVFKKIRKFSRRRSTLLNLAMVLKQNLETSLRDTQRQVVRMMKTNEKDYLKTELFVDIFSSYVTKEYQEVIRTAFIEIQLYGFDVARKRIEESERELVLERERQHNLELEAQRWAEQRFIAEQEALQITLQANQQQRIQEQIRYQMEMETMHQEMMAQERAAREFAESQHRQNFERERYERSLYEQQNMIETQNLQLRILEQQRLKQMEEQKLMKMRLRSIEQERQHKARQRAEEEARIRQRLEEEMKVRQRLEQELKVRQKTEQQLRAKIRMDEEARIQHKQEQPKVRQRVIEQQRSSPILRYTQSDQQSSRNSEENRRVTTKQFQGDAQSNKKGAPQIPPMRMTKQKIIEEQLRDDYSAGVCTTEKSENLTPRVQSDTNLEYFQQQRTVAVRQQYSSGQKVQKKELDEQVGRSQNKKKIVLSKRASIDDGVESAKTSHLRPLQLKNASVKYDVTVRVNDSPIRTAFALNEHVPKAVYRHYPDQISKEIEDIPDNLKLFMETHDHRPQFSLYGQLQFSEVKSSMFGSDASATRHQGGILSQISKLKEQESQMKANRLDNQTKFTSPAQFFRTNEPPRPLEQFQAYKHSVYSQQQEPVRDSGMNHQSAHYMKHKSTTTLAMNSDHGIPRTNEGLYVSRRIKESCMEGSRKEQAQMQDPRQASEVRKRTDSQTRSIRLTDPSRPGFDKSCSSDTKLRSIQMVKTVTHPNAFTTQSLTPADAPQNHRRPNSEMAHLHRITFDLKKDSQQHIHPQFQQAPNPNTLSHTVIGSAHHYTEGAQPPMVHTIHLQPAQAPPFYQSEYYFNRSKQPVMQSNQRHP